MDNCESFCSINWAGKEDALKLVTAPTDLRLEFIEKLSRYPESTENAFIEGDNLDALKILLPKYRGQVAMIYLDPPYNTGHRFVYKDDFHQKRTPPEYQHARWCSMMYPRLALAYELLAPEGALFISLDDRELGHLRLICDEICGSDNFVTQIIWETKKAAKGIPPGSMCIINHEYIVVYSKSKKFHFKGELRREADGFKNPDRDPRGPWKRQYLQRFGQGFPERELRNPANGMVFRFETPYTEKRMNEWLAEGSIIFPQMANRYPARKEYFSSYKNPYKPILSSWGLYPTKNNSEKLKALLHGIKCFDYPKPITLLQRLIEQSCPKSGLIIDMFAGSGSLAHATMLQNVNDGGRRRCISIQTPEIFEPQAGARRLGYKTISDMCIGRLEKAGDKIRAEHSEADVDLGWRYYRLFKSRSEDSAQEKV